MACEASTGPCQYIWEPIWLTVSHVQNLVNNTVHSSSGYCQCFCSLFTGYPLIAHNHGINRIHVFRKCHSSWSPRTFVFSAQMSCFKRSNPVPCCWARWPSSPN
jgi:hypothetical protein